MAVNIFYKEKKNRAKPYTDDINAAAPRAQSAQRLQGAAPQTEEYEKSPSELGEEVLALMLDEDAKERAAATPAPAKIRAAAGTPKAAQYGRFTQEAAGNAKTAQYGSGFTEKTAAGNRKTASYGGAGDGRMAAQYEPPLDPQPQALAAAGLDDNAIRGTQWNNDFPSAMQKINQSIQKTNERMDAIRAMPEWQAQAAAQDLSYAGLDANAQLGFDRGPSFANWLSRMIEETSIAPDMPASLYMLERLGNGTEYVAEGLWNGGVDYGRALVNDDLNRQIQQAQQLAWLGEPYRQYADLVTEAVLPIQESLPEAAENLRSHKAAEHAQQIEEAYKAGGFIKVVGDVFSAMGNVAPIAGLSTLIGTPAGLSALFLSAEGNASAEARAGGASEDEAFVYGNLVGIVEVGTELMFGGNRIVPTGVLDNVLSGAAQTNMGRVAWKAVQDALGEGAEEFISEVAEAYLAKLWNGDERDVWQTFYETFPEALYAAFLGASASLGMNAPGNISNVQYARALDAALGVINNGGTLSDAQMAAAEAARQALTNNMGKDSKWSRSIEREWMDATRNWLPETFHSDFKIVEIENEQNYRAVERGEATVFSDNRHPEITAQRITTYEAPVYVSENAVIKPKALHRITRYTQAAMERYGIPRERMPTVVIVSETEMSSAWGRYDAVNNVVYYSQWVESEQFTEPRASVEYHEMWHMKQAEEFRQKGWVITEENRIEYMRELCLLCKKKLDAAGINMYNTGEISDYASRSYLQGRYDEVEAEIWTNRMKNELIK